jgi:hypothetical protein
LQRPVRVLAESALRLELTKMRSREARIRKLEGALANSPTARLRRALNFAMRANPKKASDVQRVFDILGRDLARQVIERAIQKLENPGKTKPLSAT